MILVLVAGGALAQGLGLGSGLDDLRLPAVAGVTPPPPGGHNLLLAAGGNILLVGGGDLQCAGSC